MSNTLKHNYVSEIDQFLQDFDQNYSQKSVSQQCEIDKHARIQQLRDQALKSEVIIPKRERVIWEKF